MVFLIVHEMSLNFPFTLRVHSCNQLFAPFQTNVRGCIVSFFFSLIENELQSEMIRDFNFLKKVYTWGVN